MGRDCEADAFGDGVNAAMPSMVRYAASLVGWVAAEEVAQEAALRAWRYLDSFDGRGSFEGWLIRITRRCALDALARPPIADHRPRQPAGDHEDAVILATLVRSLPPTEREPFALTQLGGLSYAETAEILDIPIGTVRSRIARARRLLTEQLREADAS